MPGVQVLVAEDAARDDGGDGLAVFELVFVLFEYAVLHYGSMGRRYVRTPLLVLLFGDEGVVFVAGRMVVGEVERTEHMEVVIDLARFHGREAHAVEDIKDGVELGHQRVAGALVAGQELGFVGGF